MNWRCRVFSGRSVAYLALNRKKKKNLQLLSKILLGNLPRTEQFEIVDGEMTQTDLRCSSHGKFWNFRLKLKLALFWTHISKNFRNCDEANLNWFFCRSKNKTLEGKLDRNKAVFESPERPEDNLDAEHNIPEALRGQKHSCHHYWILHTVQCDSNPNSSFRNNAIFSIKTSY